MASRTWETARSRCGGISIPAGDCRDFNTILPILHKGKTSSIREYKKISKVTLTEKRQSAVTAVWLHAERELYRVAAGFPTVNTASWGLGERVDFHFWIFSLSGVLECQEDALKLMPHLLLDAKKKNEFEPDTEHCLESLLRAAIYVHIIWSRSESPMIRWVHTSARLTSHTCSSHPHSLWLLSVRWNGSL